jgi:putative membrane protein
MSIPPTLQFLRWVRGLDGGATNAAADYEVLRVRRYLVAELILFVFIPLMATLMARGIGIQPDAQ